MKINKSEILKDLGSRIITDPRELIEARIDWYSLPKGTDEEEQEWLDKYEECTRVLTEMDEKDKEEVKLPKYED